MRIMDAVQQLAEPCEAVLERFRVDTRYIAAGAPASWKGGIVPGRARRHSCGTTSRTSSASAGPCRMTRRSTWTSRSTRWPTRRSRDVKNYPLPKGDDPSRFAGLRERALALKSETPYAVVSGISGVVYEICWYMRGLEQWFCDLMTEPEFCEAMLDQTLKFWMDWFRAVPRRGRRRGGRDHDRRRPGRTERARCSTRRSTAASSSRGTSGSCNTSAPARSAKIWYHTCGSCVDFIPDLHRQRHPHPQPGADQRARTWTRPSSSAASASELVFWGGGVRCATRPAARHAGGSRGERPPERAGPQARRRLRLQQRPQHPGRSAAGCEQQRRKYDWPFLYYLIHSLIHPFAFFNFSRFNRFSELVSNVAQISIVFRIATSKSLGQK